MSGSIQTFTGRLLRPLALTPEDVAIKDIAHALSQKCRFTGHCSAFYSVAQHSVLVADLVAEAGGDPDDVLWGLLHDATEAYLPDFAAPVKGAFRVMHSNGRLESIRDVETRTQRAIFLGLGLQATDEPAVVKRADKVALATEARDLMTAAPYWQILTPHPKHIRPMSPQTAAAVFLARFEALRKALTPPRCRACTDTLGTPTELARGTCAPCFLEAEMVSRVGSAAEGECP